MKKTGIELFIRDKNGNIFIQKKTKDGFKIMELINEIENDVFEFKPRHIIMLLNKSIDNTESIYDNGIKISKKTSKKYKFKFKSIKNIRKGVKKFIKEKTKMLGEDHPIAKFTCDPDNNYRIFIDQKKKKIFKNWGETEKMLSEIIKKNRVINTGNSEHLKNTKTLVDKYFEEKDKTEKISNIDELKQSLIQMEFIQDKIRYRAEKIYNDNDCIDGQDEQNWIQAENEILNEYLENENDYEFPITKPDSFDEMFLETMDLLNDENFYNTELPLDDDKIKISDLLEENEIEKLEGKLTEDDFVYEKLTFTEDNKLIPTAEKNDIKLSDEMIEYLIEACQNDTFTEKYKYSIEIVKELYNDKRFDELKDYILDKQDVLHLTDSTIFRSLKDSDEKMYIISYIFDNLYDISKPEENVDEMLRSEELKPYINKFYKFLTNEKN